MSKLIFRDKGKGWEKEYDKLASLEPEAGDEDSISVVKAIDILERFGRKQYEKQLAKLCFLAKDRIFIKTKVVKSKEGHPLKVTMENKGFGFQPFQEGKFTYISTLRIKRQLYLNGFIVKEEKVVGKRTRLYIAEPMPKLIFDPKKYEHLFEYPLHTIVETPFSYWDKRFRKTRNDWESGEKKWVKWGRVDELIKSFKIYLFLPIIYCKHCKRIRNGGHRRAVAWRMGRKTLRHLIFECWWDSGTNCFLKRYGKVQ